MGHYASEMSSTWMDDEGDYDKAGLPKWMSKGFKKQDFVNNHLECLKCYCLVHEKSWRAHRVGCK